MLTVELFIWFGSLEFGGMDKSGFNPVIMAQDRLGWSEPLKGSEKEKIF